MGNRSRGSLITPSRVTETFGGGYGYRACRHGSLSAPKMYPVAPGYVLGTVPVPYPRKQEWFLMNNEVVYATGYTPTGETVTWKRLLIGDGISAHLIVTGDGTTANFGSHAKALEMWLIVTSVFPSSL